VAAQIAGELAAFARWQQAQEAQEQKKDSDCKLPTDPSDDDAS
jgi:hypothetical protein